MTNYIGFTQFGAAVFGVSFFVCGREYYKGDLSTSDTHHDSVSVFSEINGKIRLVISTRYSTKNPAADYSATG